MSSNESLIRAGYQAMAMGDASYLAQLLTPETVWNVHGKSEFAGRYVGPQEIFPFWKKVAMKTGGGLRLKIIDVLANENRVVVIVEASGERNGKTLRERQFAEFCMASEKIVSASFVYENPDVYDAFWED